MLTYGALFAGYGGLEKGIQSVLGGELSWYSEWEKAPSAIMAHHHPDVPNLGDVTKVDWATVPKVDVITGGSPCQDVSHAGKRAGMKAGTRSGLWASMCDAIDIIRPKLVVWENVRGALSAEADSAMEPCPGCVGGGDDGPVLRALGRVLGDLADIGYDSWWYGLRAADVGAAHGRFRVFLFASPANTDLTGLEERRDRESVPPPPVGAPAAADRDSDVRPYVPGHLTLLPTPAVNDMGAGKTVEHWDDWTAKMQTAHGNGNGHGKSLSIEALRLLPTPRTSDTNGAGAHGNGGIDLRTTVSLMPTPRATDGTKGGPNQRGSSGDLMRPSAVHQVLPTPHTLQDWGTYAAAIARAEYLFAHRPAPPPTEPGAKGQPRLSPRFVEWLMGLADGHVTDVPGVSRNDQLKALGNGVCPPQAAAATRAWLTDTLKEATA